jgi:cytochrome P450
VSHEFDRLLTEPSFYTDPYPAYATLRTHAPVHWSEAWGGWVLTRYDDATAILHDPDRYSSAGRIAYLLRGVSAEERNRLAALETHYRAGIAHVDPPDHTRLRGLVARFFLPARLRAMEPAIAALVDGLIRDTAAANATSDGTFDLIRDVAFPMPAMVVLALIGAPVEDRGLFRTWALGINELFAAGGRVAPDVAARAQRHLADLRAYIEDLAAARRRAPQDDVITALTQDLDAGKLSEQEMISTCVTLFVAGHDTTTNVMGNGMLAFMRHRDQWEQLVAAPGLAGSAVEEIMRFDTSVQRGWRMTTVAVTLHGQTIPAGDMVLPMFGAANRDPDQFPEPDRFDISRTSNRHLGFGQGIHFCLGAPLARLEMTILFQQLAARFPHLALTAEALQWRRDVALRGVETLRLAMDNREVAL